MAPLPLVRFMRLSGHGVVSSCGINSTHCVMCYSSSVASLAVQAEEEERLHQLCEVRARGPCKDQTLSLWKSKQTVRILQFYVPLDIPFYHKRFNADILKPFVSSESSLLPEHRDLEHFIVKKTFRILSILHNFASYEFNATKTVLQF